MTTMAMSGTALLEAARTLGPEIQATADQVAAQRRLPLPLFRLLADAGLFRMLVPRSLGGQEVDPVTLIHVVEEIARADGSAGWLVFIGATSGILSGSLERNVAREIFGDPYTFVSFVGSPGGRATHVDGGYRVDGRWRFASGSRQATWLAGTCSLHGPTGAQQAGPQDPGRCIVLLPAAHCQILDTWHVTGLCGSGSDDVVATDAFVPEDHAIAFDGPLHESGPLYAYGRMVIPVAMASVPLGIARAAIDAFIELAATKPHGQGRLRDRGAVQAQVGRAEARLRAAHAFLVETVRTSWASILATGTTSSEQRAFQRLAASHAAATSAQVVDIIWTMAGATAIFDSSPFARRLGDIHVATQNVTIADGYYETVGRILLGLDPPTSWP